MNTPANLKYSENDEWILVNNNHVTMGITDYAQDQLSDIVFVEFLVDEGETVDQGDTIATVESVKAAADVYATVSGTITAINEDLSDSPELINTDPYGDAWLVKITLSDPSELDELMDAEAYANLERDN
ncbi:MAG: glycine cleavage system protein GcvH [Anaerolineales bacterium]|jgi:glycine cleavage system H protein|nr:glycine cleavage system protein GcvH [Anaerolineales bacterium]